MNYYRIAPSTDRKVMGIVEQIEDTFSDRSSQYPATKHLFLYEDPNAIDNKPVGEEITDCYTLDYKVNDKAVLTEYIRFSAGTSGRLLVSNKLRLLIEKFQPTGLQFLSSYVFYKGEKLQYWVLNPLSYPVKYINFPNSEFGIYQGMYDKIKDVTVSSYYEYLELREIIKKQPKIDGKRNILAVEKLVIDEGKINDHLFWLKIAINESYFVSEELRQAIEELELHGINFIPANLSEDEIKQRV